MDRAPTFAIRRVDAAAASPALLARLGELVVDSYEAVGALGRNDDYAPILRDLAGRARDAIVLAAVDQPPREAVAVPLGCVTYVPDPANPLAEHLRDGEASIRMLAVAREAQGKGVGAALVAACLERARDDGRRAVFLHSLPVQTAAQRLYARAGFVRVPERDWFVDGLHLQAFRLALG